MNAPFQLTPRAEKGLDAIWSFIAEDSWDAAERVQAKILAAVSRRIP